MNEASPLAATAITTAVIEAAEKEVAVKSAGRLRSSMPNARHKGEGHMAKRQQRNRSRCGPLPFHGHILVSFGKALMMM